MGQLKLFKSERWLKFKTGSKRQVFFLQFIEHFSNSDQLNFNYGKRDNQAMRSMIAIGMCHITK